MTLRFHRKGDVFLSTWHICWSVEGQNWVKVSGNSLVKTNISPLLGFMLQNLTCMSCVSWVLKTPGDYFDLQPCTSWQADKLTSWQADKGLLPRCLPPSWCSSAMESCCRLDFWHCDGTHCLLYKQIIDMTKPVVPGRGWEDSPASQSLQWEQDIGEQVCLCDYLFQSDSILIPRVGAVKPSTGQHSNTEVEVDQEEQERREEIRQEMEDKEREAELVARLANQLDHRVLHPELSVYYRLWQRMIAS